MKYHKYKAKKTKIDNITFDSLKEAKRYKELKLLERAKKIQDLQIQPCFILQDSFKHKGETHRAIKYIADFSYSMDGVTYIEDVKGFKTDIYNLKKKLFLKKYGEECIFKEIS